MDAEKHYQMVLDNVRWCFRVHREPNSCVYQMLIKTLIDPSCVLWNLNVLKRRVRLCVFLPELSHSIPSYPTKTELVGEVIGLVSVQSEDEVP